MDTPRALKLSGPKLAKMTERNARKNQNAVEEQFENVSMVEKYGSLKIKAKRGTKCKTGVDKPGYYADAADQGRAGSRVSRREDEGRKSWCASEIGICVKEKRGEIPRLRQAELEERHYNGFPKLRPVGAERYDEKVDIAIVRLRGRQYQVDSEPAAGAERTTKQSQRVKLIDWVRD
ncbi:hypothetical protein C8Q75DRAFT_736075 [Abortiporus biennis]|nr:hypothetical protein C8Q75DRAFT_736075 [Abortiporus biennis]